MVMPQHLNKIIIFIVILVIVLLIIIYESNMQKIQKVG
jgi:hypothetical protein